MSTKHDFITSDSWVRLLSAIGEKYHYVTESGYHDFENIRYYAGFRDALQYVLELPQTLFATKDEPAPTSELVMKGHPREPSGNF